MISKFESWDGISFLLSVMVDETEVRKEVDIEDVYIKEKQYWIGNVIFALIAYNFMQADSLVLMLPEHVAFNESMLCIVHAPLCML